MQLGARWRVGETPHRSVPPSLHRCIAEQEAAHSDASSWTLTWLEGRPRCALDGLVTVALDASGLVVCEQHATNPASDSALADIDDDDDWLS